MQWIICHWQIHYSFGASKMCLCSEYNVQKSNEVAWRRKDGRGDGYLQRLLLSSIYPWCYRRDTNTHSKTQRNICWRFFFFQIQVIQHVITSCWQPKEVHIYICGHARFHEWCLHPENFKLVSKNCVWQHVSIELRWGKYQALHSRGQRLPFGALVDDSSQANCKCAPYYTWSTPQQAIECRKSVVENAFGILKFFFKELFLKSNLHIFSFYLM